MKRGYNYIKLIVLVGLLSFNACDLDEVHYSSVTPGTFFTSPENTYAVLARPFTHWRWFIGNDRWYLQELTTDAMTCPQRGDDWYNGGEYVRLQEHTWNPDDRFVENTYNGVTGGIARTLSAKEDLEALHYTTIGMTDQDKADQVQQLETLLAWFYMRGLDFFGGMPIYDSTQDELQPRATRQATFDHIETLLLKAIPNLKVKAQLGAFEDGYIRRAAAAAILAELYFNSEAYTGIARYNDAAEICRDIIKGEYGPYELDATWWGPHSFDNDRSPEVLWTVPSTYGSTETSWHWYWRYFYHNDAGKYFGGIAGYGAPYNGFMLTPSRKPTGEIYTEYKLGNSYEKFHDLDLRKKPYVYRGNKTYEGMFLVGEQTNPITGESSRGTKLYNGEILNLVDMVAPFKQYPSTLYPTLADLPSGMLVGEENSGIRLVKTPQPNLADQALMYEPDFPMIRLTEIYYMLAECEMRAGNKGVAADLINQVRKRNFANGSDPAPVTANNLDKYRMLDEWLIEFLGEGRRRTDMIRWEVFTNDKWWAHEPSDVTKNRFPIPYTAISANPLIKQNPGYGSDVMDD
ncbi:RagB/SusD family nutrient uptake outer membrane protein [Proteiniphilum sp. UBA5384]|uniref:RagB/SusD family nutrient uptake outer membrane protein n=1 Tax=Proteiniphilum sp. UBA5384 TaxID=1947279 RepID=UPI0025F67203|nr:RagB/SusD family nutrient uptake outer membrane protein [Proteiniphilum sp. UBA5384]